MTKSEVIHKLKVSREWNHFKGDSEAWRDAFLLYNATHGTALKPNCNKCFLTVREWLER